MRKLALFALAAVCLSAAAQNAAKPVAATPALISPTDPRIVIVGRWDVRDASQPRIGYPGVSIRFRFSGSSAAVLMTSDTENSFVTTIVDGGPPQVQQLAKGQSELVLATGLDAGPHTAEIAKRTETWQGIITFQGIRLADGGSLLDPAPLPRRKLMFIGDSVTCGAGMDRTAHDCKDGSFRPSDGYDSYGMLLGRRLDAQTHLVCYGGRGVVRDYRGRRDVLNGPQFFSSAVPSDDPGARADWPMDRWVPDAIFVSLGTNDFNLDKTDPVSRDEFVNTYVEFVRNTRRTYPDALIFLTEGAIVSDESNPERRPLTVLRGYVQETAQKLADPKVRWVASRHYNGETCDAHPIKSEHQRMADDFEPIFRNALGW